MSLSPFPLSRVLRLAVAVILTAIVLYQADPSEVVRSSAGADLRWIGAAVLLVLADRTLMAMRWIDLLSALTPGSRPPFTTVVRIFFVSTFVGNFVPSVAADMYRAYALARHDVRLAESAASVLMDRVLGVLSMVIVGVSALIFSRDLDVRREVSAGLALASAACAIAATVVFSERAALAVQRLAARTPWLRVHQVGVALTGAVRRYARHHAELLRVLVMSVCVQVIRVLQAWCLGQALGIELPLGAYFALVPIILIVIQLPITINGLGTAQLAFDRLFVPAGVPAAPVFALSVLFIALGIVGNLPGGLLYAFGSSPKQSEAPGS